MPRCLGHQGRNIALAIKAVTSSRCASCVTLAKPRIRPACPLGPPGHGDQVVQVRVAYQMRREANAFPASSIGLDLLVQERPLVGRVLPSEGRLDGGTSRLRGR
jgi:hypothetical protein